MGYFFRARPFQVPVSNLMKKCRNCFGAKLATLDYETGGTTPERLEAPSPRSRELQDFETYNRTALPLLVEASLRATMESEFAPIEERLRAMVVDIVRTCQSAVAQNFHLTIAPASSANDQSQSPSRTILSIETAVQTHGEPFQSFPNSSAANPPDFYREPPHLSAEASIPFASSIYSHGSAIGSQNSNSDSGYGSAPPSCDCSCHGYSNTWNTANGEKILNYDPCWLMTKC